MSEGVPEQIRDAAEQVAAYFNDRGILSWSLGGLQPYRPAGKSLATRIIDATHHDLYRAMLTQDLDWTQRHRVVAAMVQHLGFCCLGGRTMRLHLPNGRTLQVTLEDQPT